MDVVAICMEDTPGYPDPLIYQVKVPEGTSIEDIEQAVIERRLEDLGEEFRWDIKQWFHVKVAWAEPLGVEGYLIDTRV